MATEIKNEDVKKPPPSRYTLRSRTIPMRNDAELQTIRLAGIALRSRRQYVARSRYHGMSKEKFQKLLKKPSHSTKLLTGPPKTADGKMCLKFAKKAIKIFNEQSSKDGNPTYEKVKLRRARGVGLAYGGLYHLNFEARRCMDKNNESPQPEVFFADIHWPYLAIASGLRNERLPMEVRRCCNLGPKGSETAASGPGVCFHCLDILHPTDGIFTGLCSQEI